jgi:dihydrofolate reductase
MTICQKTKAIIMGKTTYNILAPDHLPLKSDGTTVVLTTDTDAKSANPTVVFTNRERKDVISMLEERGHTDAVIIGGAITVSEFMRSGAVADIYSVVELVLLGNGLPLLKDNDIECKLNRIEVTRLN